MVPCQGRRPRVECQARPLGYATRQAATSAAASCGRTERARHDARSGRVVSTDPRRRIRQNECSARHRAGSVCLFKIAGLLPGRPDLHLAVGDAALLTCCSGEDVVRSQRRFWLSDPSPRTDHALSAPRLLRLIFIRPCSAQQHLFPGDMNPGARRAPALRAAAGPEPSPGRVTSRNLPVSWTSTHPDIAAPPERRKPMSDEPSVTDLMARARNRDKQARDTLVERYAPLIWSICRRHRRRCAR